MTTEADIKAWIATYPRNWDQMCQALMWRLCQRFGKVHYDGIVSAFDAYRIEREAGRLRTSRPPAKGGVFVYFDIGGFDHVGYVMNNGRVFMTGRADNGRIVEEWGNRDVGWNTIDGYIEASGASYYGWSPKNGGNYVENWEPDNIKEEEPMPDHKVFVDTRTRKLAPGEWHNVYLDPKDTPTSFANGRRRGTAVLTARLTGLPSGVGAKVRLLHTKYGTNEIRGGTTVRELPGTTGGTYASVPFQFDLNHDDEGVRFQIAADGPGVSLIGTEVTVQDWSK